MEKIVIFYKGEYLLCMPLFDRVVPTEIQERCGKASADLAIGYKNKKEWRIYELKLKEVKRKP